MRDAQNAKQAFFAEATHKRQDVIVYTMSASGVWFSTVYSPGREQYTLSTFGFVRFDMAMNNNAWVRWSDVFHMVTGTKHCVDWSRLPKSVVGDWPLSDVMNEYKLSARNVAWFGAVSIGGRPIFTKTAVPRHKAPAPILKAHARAQARGWRVIAGGAA